MTDPKPSSIILYKKPPDTEDCVTLKEHVIKVIEELKKTGNKKDFERLKRLWGSSKLKQIWDEYKDEK